MYEEFRETLKGTEGDLGLPAGFLVELLDGDSDWSFVIKIHSLIEAALTHLLTGAFGRTELLPLFGRLHTSDTRTGKLAFAKALKLVDRNQAAFIQTISELRNRVVHDVHSVLFSFAAYVESLDANDRRTFSRAITLPLNRMFGAEPDATRIEAAKKAARFLVWNCAIDFVMDAFQLKLQFEFERQWAEAQRRRLGELDPSYLLTIRDALGRSKENKSEK